MYILVVHRLSNNTKETKEIKIGIENDTQNILMNIQYQVWHTVTINIIRNETPLCIND